MSFLIFCIFPISPIIFQYQITIWYESTFHLYVTWILLSILHDPTSHFWKNLICCQDTLFCLCVYCVQHLCIISYWMYSTTLIAKSIYYVKTIINSFPILIFTLNYYFSLFILPPLPIYSQLSKLDFHFYSTNASSIKTKNNVKINQKY